MRIVEEENLFNPLGEKPVKFERRKSLSAC